MKRMLPYAALAVAAVLAQMAAPPSLYAERSRTIGGSGGFSRDIPKGGKSWGDMDQPDTSNPSDTVKYGVSYGDKNDNKTQVQLGGNTNDKSDKGGWWVTGGGGGEWGWNATAGAEKGGDGNWSGGVGVGGNASYGGSIGAGAQTEKWGGEKWSLQGRIAGELYAEVKGALELAIKGDKDFIGAVASGEVGAAVGAKGKLEGVVTVFGVPVTLRGEGAAMAGAKAKFEAKVGYDRESGKFVIKKGAGLVWGLGLEGTVTMEVDADKLCNMLGLEDLWNQYKAKLEAKAGGGSGGGSDDPFDSEPEGAGGDSGSAQKYQGLKSLNLVK